MEVRKAKSADLQAVASLFDSYRVWYGKVPDLEGALGFICERFNNKDSEIYICENEESLVGFVQLYPLFSSTRMKKLWLLNDLYVKEKYRGMGIASKLIEEVKTLVRRSGACAMFLETDKTNAIGNELYPKTGFQLNEISNYYEWVAEAVD